VDKQQNDLHMRITIHVIEFCDFSIQNEKTSTFPTQTMILLLGNHYKNVS